MQKTMKNIAQEEANAMKTLICVDIVTFGHAEKMQEKRSWTCAEILNKKKQNRAKKKSREDDGSLQHLPRKIQIKRTKK